MNFLKLLNNRLDFKLILSSISIQNSYLFEYNIVIQK
jgi:hypothetical protein